MRYCIILLSVVILSSCAENAGSDKPTTADSTQKVDSTAQHEDDEMTKEIIEGSFEALNR